MHFTAVSLFWCWRRKPRLFLRKQCFQYMDERQSRNTIGTARENGAAWRWCGNSVICFGLWHFWRDCIVVMCPLLLDIREKNEQKTFFAETIFDYAWRFLFCIGFSHSRYTQELLAVHVCRLALAREICNRFVSAASIMHS